MKSLILLLLSILVWIQYSLWLGKNSISDFLKIRNDILLQIRNNKKTKERNKKVLLEIKELLNNKEAIEELSRVDLNMIKSGETFYHIVQKK